MLVYICVNVGLTLSPMSDLVGEQGNSSVCEVTSSSRVNPIPVVTPHLSI